MRIWQAWSGCQVNRIRLYGLWWLLAEMLAEGEYTSSVQIASEQGPHVCVGADSGERQSGAVRIYLGACLQRTRAPQTGQRG